MNFEITGLIMRNYQRDNPTEKDVAYWEIEYDQLLSTEEMIDHLSRVGFFVKYWHEPAGQFIDVPVQWHRDHFDGPVITTMPFVIGYNKFNEDKKMVHPVWTESALHPLMSLPVIEQCSEVRKRIFGK